jgi:copper resistance protein D
MELLVDLFGYLSIVVHALTILSQSMALRGTLFLVSLARPLTPRLSRTEIATNTPSLAYSVARVAGYAGLALVLSEAATVALQTAVLMDTVDLSLRDALTAEFAVAGLITSAAPPRADGHRVGRRLRPGRWAASGSSTVFAMWRCCSTAFSCC